MKRAARRAASARAMPRHATHLHINNIEIVNCRFGNVESWCRSRVPGSVTGHFSLNISFRQKSDKLPHCATHTYPYAIRTTNTLLRLSLDSWCCFERLDLVVATVDEEVWLSNATKLDSSCGCYCHQTLARPRPRDDGALARGVGVITITFVTIVRVPPSVNELSQNFTAPREGPYQRHPLVLLKALLN